MKTQKGRPKPKESDRELRFARVFGKALQLFEGDEVHAREWLSRPQRALGGKRPIALARGEAGVHQVEAFLDQLEHGVLA